MYSRYKVKAVPSPPPDYDGTVFSGRNIEEMPLAQARNTPDAVYEMPTASLPSDTTDIGEEEQSEGTSPDCEPSAAIMLPSPEYISDRTAAINIASKASEFEQAEDDYEDHSGDGDRGGTISALLENLELSDLLLIGALLTILFGKGGDDSIILLSYLLTCGL